MLRNPIPGKDHILRYVKPTHIARDSDGEVVITGGGFIARPRRDKNEVSYNWLEILTDDLEISVQMVRESSRIKYASTGRLAMLNVEETKSALLAGTPLGERIDILHDPLEAIEGYAADPSHAVMTNVPDEENPAAELVGDVISNCIKRTFDTR